MSAQTTSGGFTIANTKTPYQLGQTGRHRDAMDAWQDKESNKTALIILNIEERAKRSPQDQIKKLNEGGYVAAKERKRLANPPKKAKVENKPAGQQNAEENEAQLKQLDQFKQIKKQIRHAMKIGDVKKMCRAHSELTKQVTNEILSNNPDLSTLLTNLEMAIEELK